MTMLKVSVAVSSGLKQPDSSHQAYLSSRTPLSTDDASVQLASCSAKQVCKGATAQTCSAERMYDIQTYVAASTILGS